MRITGVQLDLTPEVFRLQHLLHAKLITHRDEVRHAPRGLLSAPYRNHTA